MGYTLHLAKPIDPGELVPAIEHFIHSDADPDGVSTDGACAANYSPFGMTGAGVDLDGRSPCSPSLAGGEGSGGDDVAR